MYHLDIALFEIWLIIASARGVVLVLKHLKWFRIWFPNGICSLIASMNVYLNGRSSQLRSYVVMLVHNSRLLTRFGDCEVGPLIGDSERLMWASLDLSGGSPKVAIKVKTCIDCWPARAAIRVYPITTGSEHPTRASLHLPGDSPKSHYQGEDPYRLLTYSGSRQDTSHYRLALSIWDCIQCSGQILELGKMRLR